MSGHRSREACRYADKMVLALTMLAFALLVLSIASAAARIQFVEKQDLPRPWSTSQVGDDTP